jgi:hypothetical protein
MEGSETVWGELTIVCDLDAGVCDSSISGGGAPGGREESQG